MIRIATRRSPLARWQAEYVADQLRSRGHETELVLLTSEGDSNQGIIDGSQAVGLFTKRIQQAVLEGQADVAVHSLKDLPTQIDTGLTLACVPPRASVRDCLVTSDGSKLEDLPAGAALGTGSRRRMAQILARRPDLNVVPIRGNVQTRLDKIKEGEVHGVILAEAGLLRLGYDLISQTPLPTEWMLPAAGQGALGLETRGDDPRLLAVMATMQDSATRICVAAERAVLRHLRAGCLAPVATLAEQSESSIQLRAVVLSLDGTERIEATGRLTLDAEGQGDGEALGDQVAAELVMRGARPLIEAAR